MDDFVVIRESKDEGRVHIQTCVGCICRLNGLEAVK
jgi:NADH:ubiquinone oxidoreductase subunit E